MREIKGPMNYHRDPTKSSVVNYEEVRKNIDLITTASDEDIVTINTIFEIEDISQVISTSGEGYVEDELMIRYSPSYIHHTTARLKDQLVTNESSDDSLYRNAIKLRHVDMSVSRENIGLFISRYLYVQYHGIILYNGKPMTYHQYNNMSFCNILDCIATAIIYKNDGSVSSTDRYTLSLDLSSAFFDTHIPCYKSTGRRVDVVTTEINVEQKIPYGGTFAYKHDVEKIIQYRRYTKDGNEVYIALPERGVIQRKFKQ